MNILKPSEILPSLKSKNSIRISADKTATAVEVSGPSGRVVHIFEPVSSVETLIIFCAKNRKWIGVIRTGEAVIINTSLTRAEFDLEFWSAHDSVKAESFLDGRRFDHTNPRAKGGVDKFRISR